MLYHNGSIFRRLIWLWQTVLSAATGYLKTVSGSIVSITDALAKPAVGVSVAIEAVQAGTGDPSPENIRSISGWPAVTLNRTGKNLLSPHLYGGISYNPTVGSKVYVYDKPVQFTDEGNGVFSLQTSETWSYYALIVPVKPGGKYWLKFQFSSTGTAGSTRGYLNKNYVVLNGTQNHTDTSQSFSNSLTPPADAAYWFVVFSNRSTASTMLTVTRPQVELGEAPTDYAPYTGESVSVQLLGKNLFTGAFLQGYWAFANGSFTSDNKWISTEFIPCKPNTDYVTSWSNGYNTRWQGFVWFDAAGKYISTSNANKAATNGKTFKSPANAAYMAYNIAGTTSSTAISPSDIQNFQVEEGTTATAYEAPRIIYGGTLDVTTGVLTVTHKLVTVEQSDITNAQQELEMWRLTLSKRFYDQTYKNGLCNKFTVVTSYGAVRGKNNSFAFNTANGNQVLLRHDAATTSEDVIALFPVSVYYPLATPIELTLTPEEIQLLAGNNNLWADTGNTTLTYYGTQPEEVDALNLLLGGGYRNLHGPDDVSDGEALDIILNGGSDR